MILGKTSQTKILTLEGKTFKEVSKAPRLHQVEWPALCNVRNEYIYSIGGTNHHQNVAFEYAERYSILQNEWKNMPTLNVARGGASSCHLGDFIYVVGGYAT